MLSLLANNVSLSFPDVLIYIIIIGACIAITYIALRQFGVVIPAFVIQIFWIVVAVVMAILAIRFIMSL